MMTIKRFYLTFGIILFYLSSQAQGLKLSEKPEEFLADAKNVLAASGNPQANAITQNFDQNWNAGKISETQKMKNKLKAYLS
jgi:hypothetical protein